MPESFIKIAFFFSVILLVLSCQRDPGFSLTPTISFKSIRFVDGTDGASDSLPVSMSFTDGDGDLGLDNGDTTGNFAPVYTDSGVQTNPYYYNINILFLFRNTDNSYKECKDTPGCTVLEEGLEGYNGRFPRLNLADKDQPISGVLTYNIKSFALKENFNNKNIKVQISIRDRALHQSNTILTDSITIR